MKLYTVVNVSILTESQKTVQASHSVAEYVYYNFNNKILKEWMLNYSTMVFLKGNLEQIEKLIWEHEKLKKTYQIFRESDLAGQITSVTFEPVADNKLFKKFNLL